MSLTLGYQSLDIQSIGQAVSVPENKLAKLMYYLSCVFTVIQIDESSRLTDYRNYYLLSKEEEQTVLGLIALFNPKVMMDLSLFIIAPHLVPYGYSNEFYKFTDDKIGVHVNSEVVIGGVTRKVLKIMVCEESWITHNYINPIEGYTEPKKLPVSTNYSSSHSQESCCASGCMKKACSVFVVIIIIIIIVYSV